MGKCNSTLKPIIDDAFPVLEDMVKVDAILAVHHIDNILNKKLSREQLLRLNKLKTQAIKEENKPKYASLKDENIEQ